MILKCIYLKYKIFFYKDQCETDQIHFVGRGSNYQGIQNAGSIYVQLLTGYGFS